MGYSHLTAQLFTLRPVLSRLLTRACLDALTLLSGWGEGQAVPSVIARASFKGTYQAGFPNNGGSVSYSVRLHL